MIKRLLTILLVLLSMQYANAQDRKKHFITDKAYREQVNKISKR